jgi:hypothetical protein
MRLTRTRQEAGGRRQGRRTVRRPCLFMGVETPRWGVSTPPAQPVAPLALGRVEGVVGGLGEAINGVFTVLAKASEKPA